MNAPTIKTSNTTNKTGLTPVPVETHKKANFEGQMKTVVLNGSKISMCVVNGKWVNFNVSAAN